VIPLILLFLKRLDKKSKNSLDVEYSVIVNYNSVEVRASNLCQCKAAD